MAKRSDPFEKFRDATLGATGGLSGALSGAKPSRSSATPKVEEAPVQKVSKNANRKLVSFHIDNAMFLRLGQLKFETGTKYDELYNEAVVDLLKKYHKL